MKRTIVTEEPSNTTRLATLEGKVDALSESKKPWFKDPGTLTSVLALVLSLASFAYTSSRESSKDKEARATELHTTIAQLNSLTQQFSEMYVKYKNDSDFLNVLAPTFRAQTSLFATKAYTMLINPEVQASALDMALVANALQTTGSYGIANGLLERASKIAENPNEYVYVMRMIGSYGFYQDDVDAGNKDFELAQQVYVRFPSTGQSEMEMNYMKAQTELSWGLAAAPKHCDLAKEHVQQSDSYVAGMTDAVRATLSPARQQILQACPQ